MTYLIDSYTRLLGNACEKTAGFLEETAETLRWLAALTRVAP